MGGGSGWLSSSDGYELGPRSKVVSIGQILDRTQVI